jgi:hypothetical protein
MKSIVVAGALIAIAASALSLSARQPAGRVARTPEPRSERRVPFTVGESLTYDVSWSSYLTAGTAVTTVKDKTQSSGSIAYHIAAEGRTTTLLQTLYTLHYTLNTWLDAFTLLPQRASADTEEGKRHRLRAITFDRPARRAHYEIRTATVVTEDVVIAPEEQDALSAIYVLRTIALTPGASFTMPVTDAGTTYQVRFDVGAAERVRAPIGEVNARKIAASLVDAAGHPIGRNLAIWIADNPQRWPVKLQAELPLGSFTLALREAR